MKSPQILSLAAALIVCGFTSPAMAQRPQLDELKNDFGSRVREAVKSSGGSVLGGSGSSTGPSGEWISKFHGSERVAFDTLKKLRKQIDAVLVGKVSGGTQADGDADLDQFHWILTHQDAHGTVRLRMVEAGENRWVLIAFFFDTMKPTLGVGSAR